MMETPHTLADLELMIANEIQESLHLDYKASPALSSSKNNEITKDVSAFANSDGGLLIYGIEEEVSNHTPLRIDNGVAPKWSKEWLEQVLTSSITPKIAGIKIHRIPLPNGNFVVCIQVPKSFRGPHQSYDKKYYKRFNFSSFPMEHYEIEDIRARHQVVPPLVSLDLAAPQGGLFEFTLKNTGIYNALDLKFRWNPTERGRSSHFTF